MAEPVRGYARGRATRGEIIDAATQLFGDVGFRSASLREIAGRVGISHPGLLHHFPTKEALLEAVLAHRDEIDEAARAADEATGMDDAASLLRVVERNVSRPGIVELFTVLGAEATSPDHPAHSYFARRYRRVAEQFAEQFEAWRRAGTLRAGVDPATAARSVVALMDGLQVQWLYERGADGPGRVDMGATLRAYLDSLRAQ